MKVIRCVPTKGVTSGEQLSEVVMEAVQESLQPNKPDRATEWLCRLTVDEHEIVPVRSPGRESSWRMLLLLALEDLSECAAPPLVFTDLPAMLNTVNFLMGRQEVLAICNTLQNARRCFPEVFAA